MAVTPHSHAAAHEPPFHLQVQLHKTPLEDKSLHVGRRMPSHLPIGAPGRRCRPPAAKHVAQSARGAHLTEGCNRRPPVPLEALEGAADKPAGEPVVHSTPSAERCGGCRLVPLDPLEGAAGPPAIERSVHNALFVERRSGCRLVQFQTLVGAAGTPATERGVHSAVSMECRGGCRLVPLEALVGAGGTPAAERRGRRLVAEVSDSLELLPAVFDLCSHRRSPAAERRAHDAAGTESCHPGDHSALAATQGASHAPAKEGQIDSLTAVVRRRPLHILAVDLWLSRRRTPCGKYALHRAEPKGAQVPSIGKERVRCSLRQNRKIFKSNAQGCF